MWSYLYAHGVVGGVGWRSLQGYALPPLPSSRRRLRSYYYAYLSSKDQNSFSGLESYVWSKIESDDTSWLPNQKALFLQSDSQEGEDRSHEELVMQQLSRLQESLQALSDTHSMDVRTLRREIARVAEGVADDPAILSPGPTVE